LEQRQSGASFLWPAELDANRNETLFPAACAGRIEVHRRDVHGLPHMREYDAQVVASPNSVAADTVLTLVQDAARLANLIVHGQPAIRRRRQGQQPLRMVGAANEKHQSCRCVQPRPRRHQVTLSVPPCHANARRIRLGIALICVAGSAAFPSPRSCVALNLPRPFQEN
jgi:hypothetical protein